MNDMFNWPEFFCQCSGTTEDLSSDSFMSSDFFCLSSDSSPYHLLY